MGQNSAENTPEISREASPKAWRRPMLRKLPIAATSGTGPLNQGGGEGKGGVGPRRIS